METSIVSMILPVMQFRSYRLARCAVKCVSDCRWAGRAGNEDCECDGVLPVKGGRAMRTIDLRLLASVLEKLSQLLQSIRKSFGRT